MPYSISVVIPAYNSEKTIKNTILNVLQQTEPPEEVIVVDDGSTDDTASVIGCFDARLKLIQQKNQGPSVARQIGTEAASGDYIAYLDADDWWPANKIERWRKILDKEKIDFMMADLQRAKQGDEPKNYLPRNSSIYPWAKEYFQDGRKASSGIKNLFYLDNAIGLSFLLQGFPVYPSTLLVKRNVTFSVGGWDSRYRCAEDFDIGLRITRKYGLHYLNEVGAIVGLHEGHADLYNYVVKQTEGDIQVLLGHLKYESDESSYYRLVSEAVGRKYRGLGYFHRQYNNYRQACKCYREALNWPGYKLHTLTRWFFTSMQKALLKC